MEKDPMQGWRIIPEAEKESDPCACCGGVTKRVWGYLLREEVMQAAFFVEWTQGQVRRHEAFFDLIVGRWGDGTTAEDRVAVSLEMRVMEEGPQFMVVDAGVREVGKSDLVSAVFGRDQVIGTPLAEVVFGMVDAVWVGDERIAEVRE
jgi:hypothetical protein